MEKRKHIQINSFRLDNLVKDLSTDSIQFEIPIEEPVYGGYDESNVFALQSGIRQPNVSKPKTQVTRILSKKQRKHLEKVVDTKKKKENRVKLLEALATVQVPTSELKQYTSISEFQTKGLKRFFIEKEFGVIEKKKQLQSNQRDAKVSSIRGSKKKRQKLLNCYEMPESDCNENKELFARSSLESDDSTDDELTCETKVTSSKHKREELDISLAKEQRTNRISDVGNQNQYVHIDRDPEIQAARLNLPILGEEQIIMETINHNEIIIIAGETGSGKTTQVPQFLYEAGYATTKLIGITEPRRVAAISMSSRVAKEMNLGMNIVSYLIRFEGNSTADTKIKFMTDGVLLKEIESDFLLTKYSVIILDEAHERSIYTDILVGLLSRIVPTRNRRENSLKLIIMSATLRVEDFTENRRLFKNPPPVLKVDSRQFPVTIHFNKKTDSDYINAAYNKTVKIHTKLPDGGILIFVTGQQEVHQLIKQLKRAFPYNLENREHTFRTNSNDIPSHGDKFKADIKTAMKSKYKIKSASYTPLPNINLENYKIPGNNSDADLLENDSESVDEDEILQKSININAQPLWVLPLYSNLPSDKQALVFNPPPIGCRLCIVTTNIAETSLTIPNIKYVVDTGRQKTRVYDKITGVSAFVVTYTTKAGANQRAGRAGRTVPGHCYRLYSSAVFENEFVAFSVPEIQKKPVDDLILQMKSMGIDKIINFPFPSPPDKTQLKVAEEKLKYLGALKDELLINGKSESRITPLGKVISAFPVSPRFGKMLALSHQSNLLPYTICLVAALSVQEILQEINCIEQPKKSKWFLKRKLWVGSGQSLYLGDPMVLLRAVGAAEYAASQGKLYEFCEENGLRSKAITEIRKLRKQLTNEINLNVIDANLFLDPQMEPPTDIQAKLLRQIILAGMGDQVAKRLTEDNLKDTKDKIKYKYAYQRPDMAEPIFMHQNSVLNKKRPDWIVYQEIYELVHGDTTKMFMRGITAIEPEWLIQYAPGMCHFDKALLDPPPRYDSVNEKILCHMNATFGQAAWQIPPTEIEFPICNDAFRYFALFLLNGEMFIKLKQFVPQMLSTPSTIIKNWSKIIPRTESIQNRLKSRTVFRKNKLIEIWKTDSKYLLNEYQEWLPQSAHESVSVIWPPL